LTAIAHQVFAPFVQFGNGYATERWILSHSLSVDRFGRT
jgi:hypothetical protein